MGREREKELDADTGCVLSTRLPGVASQGPAAVRSRTGEEPEPRRRPEERPARAAHTPLFQ